MKGLILALPIFAAIVLGIVIWRFWVQDRKDGVDYYDEY